jgi:hypothetical protein
MTSKSHSLVIACALASFSSSAWAANLPFGQTQTDTINSAAQTNSYTFSAAASDVVNFTLVATSGSLIPKIQLYNSSGTQLSSNYSGSPYGCSGSSLEMNTVTLPSTGIYTVNVSDCNSTNTGNYALYTQRTNNATGAESLSFGQTQSGSISSVAQSNSYTFSASANDDVDFTLVVTSGGLVPKIRLYNPNGTQLSSNYAGSPYGCSGSSLELNTVTLPSTGTYTVLIGDCSGSSLEMNTVTLPSSGTYTALVGDCGDTNTGGYLIYTQRTNNAAGATNLPFALTQTGSINSTAQSNSYTFSANASDVVDFTLVATSGSLVPKIRLYNSSGALVKSNYSGSPYGCSGSSLEMNTVTLPSTGTYTVLVGDCNDTMAGNYLIYAQRINDPAGPAALAFGQVQSGTISSAAQSNSYIFSGSANDVVNLTLVATSGSLVPRIRVYSPNGTQLSSNYSGSPYGCSGSSVNLNAVTLTQSGIHTVLLGDCSDTSTGNYNLSSQCFGTCPPLTLAPVLTSLSPMSAAAGGNGFTLTVNGSNFVPSSAVYWNGNSRATVYSSSTQLTATVPASDIVTPGSLPVTVLNASSSAGPSNAIAFTVNNPLPAQTINFGALANRTLGAAPFAISATASSGLAVSFASATSGVCTVSGVTVTLVGAGVCTITASQAGNANYAAATPVSQSFTVTSPGAITWYLYNVALTGGGSLTGSLTYNSATHTLVSWSISSSPGAPAIGCPAAGCVWTNATSANTIFGIGVVADTPTFSSFALGTVNNESLLLALAGQLTAAGGTVPMVGLASNGCHQGNPANPGCVLNGYGPDGADLTGWLTTLASQTIAFAALANQALGAAPFAVSASSSSGLPVNFASTTPAVCTVSGNTVTILAAGTCTIQASQAGNANYMAATPVNQSFTVTPGQVKTISTQAFVTQLYLDLFSRQPDAPGLAYWQGLIDSGAVTRAQAAASFFTSQEFSQSGLYAIKLYVAVLGRDPDYTGWLGWFNALNAGTSQMAMLTIFLSSQEFQATYGPLSNAAFVTLVYQNVLGRAPDSAGSQYWIGQLNSAQTTRTGVMSAFINSAEFGAVIRPRAYANLLYMGFLRRTADPSGLAFWTGALANPTALPGAINGFITSTEYLARF